MFLYQLNEKQKEVFLILSDELVNSDDKLDIQELDKLELMRNEMQISATFKPRKKEELGSIKDIFSSKTSKMICLIELVGLAYIDGKFCDKEKEYLKKLCNEAGIPETKIEEVNVWVKQMLDLTYKGTELINSIK